MISIVTASAECVRVFLLLLVFIQTTILREMGCNLIVVFIFISLMTKDARYCFMSYWQPVIWLMYSLDGGGFAFGV